MMERQLLNNPGAFSASPEELLCDPDRLLSPSAYPWGVEGSWTDVNLNSGHNTW
jgi:hypothetical protein